MGKIVKLKNKKTGERVYPVTATKAVVDADSGERLNDVLLNKVEEAPMDGLQYVRKNGTWVMADIPDTAAMEKCNITLLSNQGASDASLIGASIVVMDVTGGSELLNTRWNGDKFTVEVEDGHEYKVTVGSVEGYLTPSVQSLTAMAGIERDLEFQYKTEVVTVSLSASNGASVNGQKVTIDGVSYTYNGTAIVKKVPYGKTYSVSVNGKNAYITPKAQTFSAENTTRSVSMVYQAAAVGVYIEDTTGALYESTNWDTTKTPNSIVVITSSIRRRIALDTLSTTNKWLSPSSYNSVTPAIDLTDINALREDIDGAGRAQKMRSVESSGNAATLAYNYAFPNGMTGGHIMCSGEAYLITENSAKINNCRAAIGLYNLDFDNGFSVSTIISSGGSLLLCTYGLDDWDRGYGGFYMHSNGTDALILTNY